MRALPKDAATVILIRDIPLPRAGIEILMVRRNVRSNFAPSAYVFPGGVVDKEDYSFQIEKICSDPNLRESKNIIESITHSKLPLRFFVAAIRELFEEVGILLAYQERGSLIVFNDENENRFTQYRGEINANQLSFTEMTYREKLTLAINQLSYFSHWITPQTSPLRFDTRFFVSPSPLNQEPLCDMLETTDVTWITPQKALGRRGELLLFPPTISNLKNIAEFHDVNQVISSTLNKEVPAIIPEVIVKDGKTRIYIPGDPKVKL